MAIMRSWHKNERGIFYFPVLNCRSRGIKSQCATNELCWQKCLISLPVNPQWSRKNMESWLPNLFSLINENIRNPKIFSQPRIDRHILRFRFQLSIKHFWLVCEHFFWFFHLCSGVEPHHSNCHLNGDHLFELQYLDINWKLTHLMLVLPAGGCVGI